MLLPPLLDYLINLQRLSLSLHRLGCFFLHLHYFASDGKLSSLVFLYESLSFHTSLEKDLQFFGNEVKSLLDISFGLLVVLLHESWSNSLVNDG